MRRFAPGRAMPESRGASGRPLIELGWVLVGRFDPPDRRAIGEARSRVEAILEHAFPDFDWRMPLVEREAPSGTTREEPVDLLDQGVVERQARGWDFALVVTPSDLASHYRPYALGAPARSLAAAVVSTIRIDPHASDPQVGEAERVEGIARRLTGLALHLFGHLNGTEHVRGDDDFMADVQTIADLDRMERFGEEAIEDLERELGKVADLRLEEQASGRSGGRAAFYLRALWHNRGNIVGAVRQTRFWQFPFRLSRLTTAAVSALLVLVITAEAWDLGMSQSPPFVSLLSAVVLVATSGYILRRQRLLVRREGERLTELSVVSDVSIAVSVMLGMLTMYVLLFAFTLLLAQLFFRRHLVEIWAASLDGRLGAEEYLVFAAFVASLGLLIGSLGASFEEQRYFRHVAYVDEET